MKLLLVDDLPQNLRLLEGILAPHGYQLVTATSGGEALERVADSRPDLVLLDVMMPGLDGYEVCRRLRADPDTSFLPVIFVTVLAGDGIEVFFNDPIECDDPAERAVRMGLAIRELMAELTPEWRRRGYKLGFGVGIALGYATLGQIGFEGRFDYAALGSVTILAARLSDAAADGQVLVSQRAYAEVSNAVDVEELSDLTLKGFTSPVPAVNAVRVKPG